MRSARVSAASSDVDVLESELVSEVAVSPANDARVLELIDALAAGHAPTEEICWSLARAFERAGEAGRADKVLAYMETRGML